MDKVKLNLRLSPEEIVAFAQNVHTSMDGNGSFTTPIPPLTTLETQITGAQGKIATQISAANSAKLATSDRDASLETLGNTLRQLAAYVEAASGGDKVKIESAGFSVRATPGTIGELAQVSNLSTTEGDDDGELDAQWDRVYGAKSYQVETSPDPITSSSWTLRDSPTKTRCTITGLTSGVKTWVRVRAIGAAGPGPWSDPAVKMVP